MLKILILIFLMINIHIAEELSIKNNNIINNENEVLTEKKIEQPLIINQGTFQNDNIEQMILQNIPVEEIEKTRRMALEYEASLKKELNEYIIKNKEIDYKKGMIVEINTLANNPTIIEFYDVLKNKVEIDYISNVSNYFTIAQDKKSDVKHRLVITPNERFRNSNILVGIKGFDYPIQLRLKEMSNETYYSNFIKIELVDTTYDDTKVIDKIKKETLSKEIKLKNFKHLKIIDYEMFPINKDNFIGVWFDNKMLKIHYIDNQYKGYYLVILHNSFKIEGYSNTLFQKYNDEYQVYMLNFNMNVFTIRNKETNERYRIIIKS